MRQEVVSRATDSIYEFMTNASVLQVSSPVVVEVEFDEFKLEVDLDYEGLPMHLPETPPSVDALGAGEGAVTLLSGYIIRQYADRLKVTSRNGHCHIHLHFEH